MGQSPSGETTTWVGVTSRHSSKAPCARFGVFSHRTFCSGTGRRTGGALCPPCAFLVTNIHPWLGPSYGRCLVPALGLARADTLSHSQSGRHKARPLQGLLTTNVLARNEPLYGRCLVPALGLARADTLSHSQSGRHKARPLQGLLATNVLARNEPSYGRCLVPALGLSRHEHPSVARAVVRAVPCARPGPCSRRQLQGFLAIQATRANSRRMVVGSRSIALKSALAGASGVDRRCSQSRRVPMGRSKASANSTWVKPRRCLRTFTRDTRRIAAKAFGVSGAASGSPDANAWTSASDILSRRAQSLSP